jgi:hypothetical protein
VSETIEFESVVKGFDDSVAHLGLDFILRHIFRKTTELRELDEFSSSVLSVRPNLTR